MKPTTSPLVEKRANSGDTLLAVRYTSQVCPLTNTLRNNLELPVNERA